MGLMDYLLSSNTALRLRSWLTDGGYFQGNGAEQNRLEQIMLLQEYSRGNQRQALPVKLGKPNDNVTLNMVGKVVNKSVAMLFGGEIEFNIQDPANAVYLNEQWSRNRKPIFLHKLGRTGAESGTVYIEVVKDGYGDGRHRLISLNPSMMRIDTDPEDVERVIRYVQAWAIQRDGKTVMRRRIVERARSEDGEGGVKYTDDWTVELQENKGREWVLVEATAWPLPFPPILHGQNLPVDDSPYGESDIEDVIGLQDSVNYIASNIKKIIRYHAHPKTIGKGFRSEEGKPQEVGADVMIYGIPVEGDVFNLEMQSDLSGTREYLNFLVQNIFSLSSTVDLSSLKDKLGQLTNFAVRVLYQDASEKLAVKRDLYGEMLTEINRRLLALKGANYEETDGGQVVWPEDVTPQNELEEAQAVRSDLEVGLVSKRTASIQRGYDWDGDTENGGEGGEQAAIMEDKASEDNVGAALLRAFNRGQ